MSRESDLIATTGAAEADGVMLACPNGHASPAGWTSCGECGARLRGAPRWGTLGRHPIVWGVVLIATAFATVAGIALTEATSRPDLSADDSLSSKAATQQWWSHASADIDELVSALDDTERAIKQWDSAAFNEACQRMHDTSAVSVPSRLPAPDPTVTAELSAAADDAHAASHMCLAVFQNSANNYDGEFTAALEQAARHVEAARVLVDVKMAA